MILLCWLKALIFNNSANFRRKTNYRFEWMPSVLQSEVFLDAGIYLIFFESVSSALWFLYNWQVEFCSLLTPREKKTKAFF